MVYTPPEGAPPPEDVFDTFPKSGLPINFLVWGGNGPHLRGGFGQVGEGMPRDYITSIGLNIFVYIFHKRIFYTLAIYVHIIIPI